MPPRFSSILSLVLSLPLLLLTLACSSTPASRFPGTDDASGEWAEELLGGPPELGVVVRVHAMRDDPLFETLLDTLDEHAGDDLDEAASDDTVRAAARSSEIQLYGRRRPGAPGGPTDDWDDAYFVLAVLDMPAGASVEGDARWERTAERDAIVTYRHRSEDNLSLWIFPSRAWVIAYRPVGDTHDAIDEPVPSELEPGSLLAAYVQGGVLDEDCEDCPSADSKRVVERATGALVHLDPLSGDGDLRFGVRMLYEGEEQARETERILSESISEDLLRDQGYGRLAEVVAAVLDRTVEIDRDGSMVSVDVSIPYAVVLLAMGKANGD